MEMDALVAARHKGMAGFLDERQRRLHAAVEAKALGHGGVKRVSEATGVARGSILAAMKELEQPELAPTGGTRRVRRIGGGRKSVAERDTGLREALDRLVEPEARGVPCRRCDGPARASCNWRANWSGRTTRSATH